MGSSRDGFYINISLLRAYGLNSLNVPPAMLLMSPEDAFQILNLFGKVTPDEIKHAYRIMVNVAHRP